jgi:hypothetical protein
LWRGPLTEPSPGFLLYSVALSPRAGRGALGLSASQTVGRGMLRIREDGRERPDELKPSYKKSIDRPPQIGLLGKLKLTNCAPITESPGSAFLLARAYESAPLERCGYRMTAWPSGGPSIVSALFFQHATAPEPCIFARPHTGQANDVGRRSAAVREDRLVNSLFLTSGARPIPSRDSLCT